MTRAFLCLYGSVGAWRAATPERVPGGLAGRHMRGLLSRFGSWALVVVDGLVASVGLIRMNACQPCNALFRFIALQAFHVLFADAVFEEDTLFLDHPDLEP